MKIEKIGENIIQVTISSNDLKERNIDLNSLNYDSPATQELFWDMMEQAETQFGFTISDSQLLFEAVPNSDEGFILTITRLDGEGDFESLQKYLKSRIKTGKPKVKKRNRKVSPTVIIYSFCCFEDLCSFGKRVFSVHEGANTLYKCKDTYYLIFAKNGFSAANIKFFDTLLNEFGKRVTNTHFYEGYLNEYGIKMIEGNALKVISDYF